MKRCIVDMKYSNKSFLITGGTGSFGSEVLRYLVTTDCERICVFSRDERKQDLMRHAIKDSRVQYFLGDVRDQSTLEKVVQKIDYIFHAAALKQVPSCEYFPAECVKTNVLGTQNVIHAAQKSGVDKLIVLSTDKAVYPINAMGMSKALMEKTMAAASRDPYSNTKLCGTRYGNVVASRGSVIPLFISQIRAGKNVTVTDPAMTRYLMSLKEAVSLVEFAFENGGWGEMFIQKAPAANVLTIAFALMRLLGKEVGVDFIGKRPGEKQHETLVGAEELFRAVDLGGYYMVPRDASPGATTSSESADVTYNSSNTEQLCVDRVCELLSSNQQVLELLQSSTQSY